MLKQCILLMLFTTIINICFAQNNKPYKCGWIDKDTAQLNKTYNSNLKYWDVQKGETVASVGAQNGNLEVRLSLFIDSINWTLQDIDSSCLNQQEFEKVLNYYEKIGGKKINSQFKLLLGSTTNTNLLSNTYDRILLINVYHELTKKQEILTQINTALKPQGSLVIMERMGNKKGKKRLDCNHIMPYEPPFLEELKQLHFELKSKTMEKNISYYIFRKIN